MNCPTRLARLRVALSVAVLLPLAAVTPSASATATSATTSGTAATTTSAQIQRQLDAAVAKGVPGVVALVRRGNHTQVFTAGLGDVARGVPMHRDDHFRIASISKTIAATTILRLVQSGKLCLDDRVSRWEPGLLPDNRITVRQLLQHTSGVFDYAEDETWWASVTSNLQQRWTARQVVAIGAAHPLYFAPGNGYHYSNTGYAALGLIAEDVTGKSMSRLVEEQVLRPAGLRHTYVSHTSRLRPPFARGYTNGEFAGGAPGGLRDVTAMNATLAVTSGDVISTVDDVSRFFRLLLGGRLLRPDLLRQMEDVISTPDGPAETYGLGLSRTRQACGQSFGHTGGIFGFSSDAEESTDGQTESVVFANTDSIPDAAFSNFGKVAELTFCGR